MFERNIAELKVSGSSRPGSVDVRGGYIGFI